MDAASWHLTKADKQWGEFPSLSGDQPAFFSDDKCLGQGEQTDHGRYKGYAADEILVSKCKSMLSGEKILSHRRQCNAEGRQHQAFEGIPFGRHGRGDYPGHPGRAERPETGRSREGEGRVSKWLVGSVALLSAALGLTCLPPILERGILAAGQLEPGPGGGGIGRRNHR